MTGGTEPYKELLLAWRKQYWKEVFESIPNIRQSNTTDGPRTVDPNVKTMHHAHVDQLSKVRNMILTSIIEEKINAAMVAGPIDDAAVVTQYKDKFNSGDHPLVSSIAYNIFNKRKGGQGIYAPTLHITRDTPLRQQDEELSASSMEYHTWLLQQVVGMMPLSKKMCRVLTSSPTFNNSLETKVILNEYAKFHHPYETMW